MAQEDIDLDYDDDLAADAEYFQTAPGVAQGVEDVQRLAEVVPSIPRESHLPNELQRALLIAREIYGETNCKYSEQFCHFVADVLAGGSTIQEARELLVLLHGDKDRFSGRWLVARNAGQDDHAELMRARQMAVWGAENMIRTIINWRKGLRYEMWLEKTLYRLTLTEKDDKVTS